MIVVVVMTIIMTVNMTIMFLVTMTMMSMVMATMMDMSPLTMMDMSPFLYLCIFLFCLGAELAARRPHRRALSLSRGDVLTTLTRPYAMRMSCDGNPETESAGHLREAGDIWP